MVDAKLHWTPARIEQRGSIRVRGPVKVVSVEGAAPPDGQSITGAREHHGLGVLTHCLQAYPCCASGRCDAVGGRELEQVSAVLDKGGLNRERLLTQVRDAIGERVTT